MPSAPGLSSILIGPRRPTIFPDLRDYIRQNHVLLSDVGYARIYVRPDRQPPPP